ncbi:uncharacterized protein METZ01_LOCUS222754, partial [marine metagenome]
VSRWFSDATQQEEPLEPQHSGRAAVLADVAARECAARIGEVGVKRPACFCVISQPKL